jgi:hypothetical protein
MLFGLIEWFADTPVALAVEEFGLDFVAVYLLTPDPDSLPRLPYFLNLIKAPRTVIVLNEWRMGADDGANAFAGIIADPRIGAARADGSRIITMPHLPPPNRLASLPQPETSQSRALRMARPHGGQFRSGRRLVRLTCAKPASPQGRRAFLA